MQLTFSAASKRAAFLSSIFFFFSSRSVVLVSSVSDMVSSESDIFLTSETNQLTPEMTSHRPTRKRPTRVPYYSKDPDFIIEIIVGGHFFTFSSLGGE